MLQRCGVLIEAGAVVNGRFEVPGHMYPWHAWQKFSIMRPAHI